ncbi:TldD/PmbA family protein [Candidatus Poriferisodalis sp.]|uniref:TldD/PmbA family protein n=1 Tax=Candidatus Poriferisodalis sp. TaxID=3101277 RepID=UPI003B0215C9
MNGRRQFDTDELAQLARQVCEQAQGPEQIEVCVSTGRSTSVRAYNGDVESLRSGHSAAIGVRVVTEGRQGFASAGSLDDDVVADTLAAARRNVMFGEPDPHQGLAEPDDVAPPGLDLSDPAVLSVSDADKIAAAIDLERRCLSADPRISGVRVAAWSDGWSQSALASSTGICVQSEHGSCSVGAQPLATDGDETQIGYAGDAAWRPDELDVDRVITESTSLATGQLGATKPPSERVTVVLAPPVAAAFIGVVASVLAADSVLKGRSPFADRVGEQIADERLHLIDDPTDPTTLGAANFDGEGLAARRNALISAGVLRGFLHNAYTARRSDTASTGSAVRGTRSLPGVGTHAPVVATGDIASGDLYASVGDGVLVRGVSGLHSGVNPTSGDFSVGAWGHRISGGELAEPFREATIASTLQRMLLGIGGIGATAERLAGGMSMPPLVVADIALSGV